MIGNFFIFVATNQNTERMKRIFVLYLAVFLTGMTLHAQMAPGLTYKQLKDVYNPGVYDKSSVDPYSPFWSGFSSFFIPGLGQMTCGESGRGWAFFGGAAGCSVLTSASVVALRSLVVTDDKGNLSYSNPGAASVWTALIITSAGAYLGACIWSVIDAVRVAKVKNMYYQDMMGKQAMQFNVYPSVNYAYTGTGAAYAAPGLTLGVRF